MEIQLLASRWPVGRVEGVRPFRLALFHGSPAPPRTRALLALVLFVPALVRAANDPAPTVVSTMQGRVQGVIEGDVRAFRGLPYAAPPVGELRWRAPRPPAPWSGVRDAAQFAPLCDARLAGGAIPFSEDCLYLNVYTPAELGDDPWPVVVYLHGNRGTSLTPAGRAPTPPPGLVSRGAIVVTVDWRAFTVLGTLDHPQLTAEADGAGNYDTLDLVAALHWVHDNIAAFSGDPGRVLVHGLSGGAIYAGYLLATPLTRGLMTAAAIESPGWTDVRPPEVAELDGLALAAAVGCDGTADPLACLRALPAEELVAVPLDVPYTGSGVIDGTTFTGSVYVMAAERRDVPLLVGSSREESTGLGFSYPFDQPFTEDDYRAALHDHYDLLAPGVVDDVLALYPTAAYPSPLAALIAVDSDALVTCRARQWALASGGKVWRWLFTRPMEADDGLARLGAFHGELVHFVFGDFAAVHGVSYAPTADELELSQRLMDTWAHFARTGNPNGGPLAGSWPATRADQERLLVIDEPVARAEAIHVPQCEFWDEHPF